MSLNENCQTICKELMASLPESESSSFQDLLKNREMHFIDELHEGLTFLAQSCMELGVLFSKFDREVEVMNHNSIVKRMTVGYLFEVYNSIWEWIGKPVKNMCVEKNVSENDFIDLKKTVDATYSKYIPLLKAIRNAAFHTKDASDKDWATSATRLLFQNNVPQKLQHCLYEFGYKINVAIYNNKIYGCYPGIGGFAAIHPTQGVMPMRDLYLAGTNIKFTPAPVS